MRLILGALIAFVSAAPCMATEIAGKWGLGVGTGDALGASPEASILYGRSSRTAWIMDFELSTRSDHFVDSDYLLFPPDTVASEGRQETFSFSSGPRIRRFLRPDARLSPYVDGFLHAIQRIANDTDYGYHRRETGGEIGLAFGVEYFIPKTPVSVAAHSSAFLGRYVYSREVLHRPDVNRLRERDSFSGEWRVAPDLRVRVYF